MTGPQLLLQLEPPRPTAFTLCGYVLDCLRSGNWLTPYQIQREVERKMGIWHSDSSITARIRELRGRKDGPGYIVERRKRENAKSFEYRIAGVK